MPLTSSPTTGSSSQVSILVQNIVSTQKNKSPLLLQLIVRKKIPIEKKIPMCTSKAESIWEFYRRQSRLVLTIKTNPPYKHYYWSLEKYLL